MGKRKVTVDTEYSHVYQSLTDFGSRKVTEFHTPFRVNLFAALAPGPSSAYLRRNS